MDIQVKYHLAYEKIMMANNILIISHTNPDADALSSIGVMIELSESLNKNYLAFAYGKSDNLFYFLPHEDKVLGILPDNFSLNNYDLIIVLDCGSLKRTNLEDEIREHKNIFKIEFDHHPPIDDYADLEIRLPEQAATTEILYSFIKANNIKINKNLANCLLSGLLTDTGNFLYPATSDQSLNMAAEMLSYGAQLPRIIQSTYQKNLISVKLLGIALKNLRVNEKYNIGISVLLNEELKANGIEEINNDLFGDTVAFLSNLAGVKGVILFREEKDEKIKANLRSAHPDINMNILAQLFGGGGHPKASGFLIKGKIEKNNNEYKIVLDPNY